MDDLVIAARDTRMAVTVHATGTPVPLSPATDAAAYRLVQEALSNARQHAPGAWLIAELARMSTGPQPSGTDPLAELTDRERETLLLIAKELSNTEIADTLIVSASTVKTHVGNLLAKLGCRDRVQAVVLAYETGAVQPGR